MSGFLAFPAPISPSHVTSATNQDGARVGGFVRNSANAGSMNITPTRAEISSSIQPLITITTAGLTSDAQYTASLDNGTTTLGRLKDSVWDDHAEGGAGTSLAAATKSGMTCVSAPFEIDSDGDGVPDMVGVVICAMETGTVGSANLYVTTDLTMQSAWSYRSNVFGNPDCDGGINCGNVAVLGSTLVAPVFWSSTTNDYIVIMVSEDSGLTWAIRSYPQWAITGGELENTVPRCCFLHDGKVAIVYHKTSTTYVRIALQTCLRNGTGLSAIKYLTADDQDRRDPTIVQDINGKCVAFWFEDGTGIDALQYEGNEPATGTWEAYSDTLATPAATQDQPCAVIAPDGTTYLVMRDTTDSDYVAYSMLAKGTSTYSAVASVHNTADVFSRPGVGIIGGELWCAMFNTTDETLDVVATKYWGTYDESDYFASWMTWQTPVRKPMQYIGSGMWVWFDTGYAQIGDSWGGETTYDYPAYRPVMLRPSHPARSTGDDADWNMVIDLSGTYPMPYDTILVQANGLTHLHIQGSSTDSWGSPDTNTSVSFIQETIASGSYTISGSTVTRSSGMWVPHALKNQAYVKFGTNIPQLIVDNTSTVLYCAAAPDQDAGDSLTILSTKAWTTLTLTYSNFIRLLIESQSTYSGKYEVRALMLAQRTELSAWQKSAVVGWSSPTLDVRTDAGVIVRTSLSTRQKRSGSLVIMRPTTALYQELATQFRRLGARPCAYVPDSTNYYDWQLIMPQSDINWEALRPTIEYEEVV